MQYPVIASVSDDGSARIILIGKLNGNADHWASVNVFKSSGAPWAPARKVWNQYMYNSVNVNEDLTVPSVQLNPATFFPGNDGVIGTADDIQPFNNFIQQQTALSLKGSPLWLTPDAKFAETSVLNYYGDGDSLVISTELTNIGDAALNAPFYVSAYKNTVAAANKMVTDSSMTVLNVEDTIDVNVTIRDFSTYSPLTNIIIRINDKGSAAYVQLECDTVTNNVFEFNPAKLPQGANDTVAILRNTPVFIDVKLNDLIPTYCSQVKPIVVVAPAAGNVTEIVDDSIKYTPDSDFYGVDSLVYRLTCTSNDTVYNAEAKVYIVVNKPISDAYIACADSVVMAGFVSVGNVTYHWYADETGGTQSGLSMDTRDCTAPSVWWVEARYKGVPVRPRMNVSIDAYLNLDLTVFSIGDYD
jgi:hypothetical protein